MILGNEDGIPEVICVSNILVINREKTNKYADKEACQLCVACARGGKKVIDIKSDVQLSHCD